MATSNERDERRRRISEKGLNRMCNITPGRAHSTSVSSLSPLDHDRDHHPKHKTNDEKKESLDTEREGSGDERRRMVETGLDRTVHPAGRSQSNPPTLNHPALFSNHQMNCTQFAHDVGGQAELKLQKLGTDDGATSALILGEKDGLQPLQASSKVESLQKPGNQPDFFASKRLNSCIIASERTRSLCALLIALVVLVAERIVASRPLYIILLTDLTVVLGRLFLDKQRDSEEAEGEKAGSQSKRENWVGAVKLLERGLVVYQTIRALSTDFSIYAVVVICGLSFM